MRHPKLQISCKKKSRDSLHKLLCQIFTVTSTIIARWNISVPPPTKKAFHKSLSAVTDSSHSVQRWVAVESLLWWPSRQDWDILQDWSFLQVCWDILHRQWHRNCQCPLNHSQAIRNTCEHTDADRPLPKLRHCYWLYFTVTAFTGCSRTFIHRSKINKDRSNILKNHLLIRPKGQWEEHPKRAEKRPKDNNW